MNKFLTKCYQRFLTTYQGVGKENWRVEQCGWTEARRINRPERGPNCRVEQVGGPDTFCVKLWSIESSSGCHPFHKSTTITTTSWAQLLCRITKPTTKTPIISIVPWWNCRWSCPNIAAHHCWEKGSHGWAWGHPIPGYTSIFIHTWTKSWQVGMSWDSRHFI